MHRANVEQIPHVCWAAAWSTALNCRSMQEASNRIRYESNTIQTRIECSMDNVRFSIYNNIALPLLCRPIEKLVIDLTQAIAGYTGADEGGGGWSGGARIPLFRQGHYIGPNIQKKSWR